MKIVFENHRFNKKTLPLLEAIKDTIKDYEDQNLAFTLRQLYYRLFSKGIIENKKSEYQKLGTIIANAKLSGELDMECIEDRTRRIRECDHYYSYEQILQTAVNAYKIDLWEGQEYRVMVFCEKDALIGIVEDAAYSLDCPCFSCRGHPSLTALWEIAQKIEGYKTVILYLGDLDPSGVIIDQKIQERLNQFGAIVYVNRIGLTLSQAIDYKIPPAEPKESDKNHDGYVKIYGKQVWELDGLPPDVIHNLVIENIKSYLDIKKYNARIKQQEAERKELKKIIEGLNF